MNENKEVVYAGQFKLGDIWSHPITGVTHVASDRGYDPQPASIPGNADLTRWRTCVIPMPFKQSESNAISEALALAAKGISEVTGKDVRWHFCRDSSCATWGDFGWFLMKR